MTAPPNRFYVMLVGDSGVGKTCLMRRVADGEFLVEHSMLPVVDSRIVTFHVGSSVAFKVHIFALSGDPRFRSLALSYASKHEVAGVVLVYDPTSRPTFEHIPDWLAAIRERELHTKAKPAQFYLVATKADVQSTWDVSEAEGRSLARTLNVPFFITSAEKDMHVTQLFQHVAEEMLEHYVPERASVAPIRLKTYRESRYRFCVVS